MNNFIFPIQSLAYAINRAGDYDTNHYFRRLVLTVFLASCINIVYAHNDSENSSPFLPDHDPSHFTDLVIGDLPEGLPEANQGAIEGGATETIVDTGENNVLQPEDQRDDGAFNIPTNGSPSPLFGAQAFTQNLLRFEEFGTKQLKFRRKRPPPKWKPLPTSQGCQKYT